MNRIFITGVMPLIAGALFTGVLLSLYAATNYMVPLENGNVLEEAAGWALDPDMFTRFLRYALPGSLLLFLVAGPVICWILKRYNHLDYSMTLLFGATTGFAITFIFNQDISLLYHGVISLIVAVGVTVSWIMYKYSHKNPVQPGEIP